jgi:hypothetical protein
MTFVMGAGPDAALDVSAVSHYIFGRLPGFPTTSCGRQRIHARLRLLESPPQAKLRGPRADIWLTVSAWLWTAYLAGVALAALWLVS